MNNVCDDKLQSVITENQNLIYSLSNKYDYRLRDDLFQVGVLGMIDAYKHYDSNRNTKFSSYAYPYVDGEIKKYIREDRNIKVSRDVIYLCSRIEKAKDILRQELKREPLVSELSLFLEIEESKLIEALNINNQIRSLDEPINEEGRELTLKDVIGGKEYYDKLDLISLRDELNKLSPMEKELLTRRYLEERTQCETAEMMGISQVEVSRNEKRLILSLRKRLM